MGQREMVEHKSEPHVRNVWGQVGEGQSPQ